MLLCLAPHHSGRHSQQRVCSILDHVRRLEVEITPLELIGRHRKLTSSPWRKEAWQGAAGQPPPAVSAGIKTTSLLLLNAHLPADQRAKPVGDGLSAIV